MKTSYILPLLSALVLCARAAVPLEWTADVERPAPAQVAVMRGETVALRAALVRRGAPYDLANAADAAIYWQTNGMGGAWWSADATIASNTIAATFTPAMDPGAPTANVFLSARDADGAIYRAQATLRFIHAPGATPNEIDLPARAIDFATVEVANAPWIETETDPTVPAWAKAATPPLTEEVDPVWEAEKDSYATAAALSAAATASTNYTDAAATAATNYTDAAIAAIPAPDLAALVPTNRMVAGVALDADIPLAGRIEVTNNTLRVFAPTNSTSDPVLAWEQPSASAILPALSAMSNLVVSLAARVAALEAGGGAAQWADFDAQGNPNPDPDSTFLNRPFAALASGFQWVSSGGCYALAASGAVAFAADTGGEVRLFGSSVSNSVGLHSVGDAVTVGCNATGFVVSGSGQSAVASITYPYSGGDYPVIYGATSPAGPWTEMTAVTWVADADAGTATASFPAVATGYFYRATTAVALGEYWHARIPSLLEGGIMTSGSDISPVVYDTTITITQGGTSYRLPAQTVQ